MKAWGHLMPCIFWMMIKITQTYLVQPFSRNLTSKACEITYFKRQRIFISADRKLWRNMGYIGTKKCPQRSGNKKSTKLSLSSIMCTPSRSWLISCASSIALENLSIMFSGDFSWFLISWMGKDLLFLKLIILLEMVLVVDNFSWQFQIFMIIRQDLL